MTEAPLTRAEQQARTRTALVASARRVFGREGFHGARLEVIAYEAGLTKGAVYSNFESKADLFLAVLDTDLANLDPDTWDPAARFEAALQTAGEGLRSPELAPEDRDALGFGLATLEFIASAGRDEQLLNALSDRLGQLHAGFEAIARRSRQDDDALETRELGAMLMGFDQGMAILWLIGWMNVEASAMRRGLRRLLTPTRGENDGQL